MNTYAFLLIDAFGNRDTFRIEKWLISPGEMVVRDQAIVEVRAAYVGNMIGARWVMMTLTAPMTGKILMTHGAMGEELWLPSALIVYAVEGDEPAAVADELTAQGVAATLQELAKRKEAVQKLIQRIEAGDLATAVCLSDYHIIKRQLVDRFGGAALQPILGELAEDPSEAVRGEAARLLGEFSNDRGGRTSVHPLLPAYDEERVRAENLQAQPLREALRSEPAGAERRVLASPNVRRLARQRRIDLSRIEGTRRGGRVCAPDLDRFVRNKVERLLAVLAARGIAVSVEDRARIETCTDAVTLDEWIVRSASARSLEDVITEFSGSHVLRSAVERFGEIVACERIGSADDLWLQVARSGSLDGEPPAEALCSFQLRTVAAAGLDGRAYGARSSVALSLQVRHLRYWYLLPVPTYLVLHVEATNEILVLNVKRYVEETWGVSIVRLEQESTTVHVPCDSVLDRRALGQILVENHRAAWQKALDTEEPVNRLCHHDYDVIWHVGTADERKVDHKRRSKTVRAPSAEDDWEENYMGVAVLVESSRAEGSCHEFQMLSDRPPGTSYPYLVCSDAYDYSDTDPEARDMCGYPIDARVELNDLGKDLFVAVQAFERLGLLTTSPGKIEPPGPFEGIARFTGQMRAPWP